MGGNTVNSDSVSQKAAQKTPNRTYEKLISFRGRIRRDPELAITEIQIGQEAPRC
jgi:hypothetical protein